MNASLLLCNLQIESPKPTVAFPTRLTVGCQPLHTSLGPQCPPEGGWQWCLSLPKFCYLSYPSAPYLTDTLSALLRVQLAR